MQFDGDFLLGLVDLNIFAVGAEAGGDYLHAQLAEGEVMNRPKRYQTVAFLAIVRHHRVLAFKNAGFLVFEKPCSVLGILYVQLGPRPKSIFTNKYAGQTKILGSRPLAARLSITHKLSSNHDPQLNIDKTG